MSKSKGKSKTIVASTLADAQTQTTQTQENASQSTQETQGDTNGTQETQENGNAPASAEGSAEHKSDKRITRPVVALTDAQRTTLANALLPLLHTLRDPDVPVVMSDALRPALRTLRVIYKGKTPSASRSGKSDAERKSERTAYRFARRYAKKHGISIDRARALYAAGKIAPSVRVVVDATNVESLDAQIARLMEQRKRLANETPESHPDALALAEQIDKQLASQES